MTETTRSQLLKVKEEEMKFVPKQLSHLSLEQVQELITRYYNGERVNVLCVTAFPKAIIEMKC